MLVAFDPREAMARLAGSVPRNVAREQILAQASEDLVEIAEVPTWMLRRIIALFVGMGLSRRHANIIVNGVRGMVRGQERADRVIDAVGWTLVTFWIQALDELRDAVDDPAPIALAHDLMPDPATVDDGPCEAMRGAIEAMHSVLSVDRTWELYAAFVAALRTEMADKAERIQISDTTILAVDHGRFTLERVAPTAP